LGPSASVDGFWPVLHRRPVGFRRQFPVRPPSTVRRPRRRFLARLHFRPGAPLATVSGPPSIFGLAADKNRPEAVFRSGSVLFWKAPG